MTKQIAIFLFFGVSMCMAYMSEKHISLIKPELEKHGISTSYSYPFVRYERMSTGETLDVYVYNDLMNINDICNYFDVFITFMISTHHAVGLSGMTVQVFTGGGLGVKSYEINFNHSLFTNVNEFGLDVALFNIGENIIEATVYDENDNLATSEMVILMADNFETYQDYNADMENDIRDVWLLASEWNTEKTVDPNDDNFINVLDLLYIENGNGKLSPSIGNMNIIHDPMPLTSFTVIWFDVDDPEGNNVFAGMYLEQLSGNTSAFIVSDGYIWTNPDGTLEDVPYYENNIYIPGGKGKIGVVIGSSNYPGAVRATVEAYDNKGGAHTIKSIEFTVQ